MNEEECSNNGWLVGVDDRIILYLRLDVKLFE